MHTRQLLLAATATFALILLQAGVPARAGSPPPALSGQVSSADEGAMEGVMVSAHKAGSTMTISVDTDQQGRYSFPADRLAPGRYELTIRALGYELDGKPAAEVAKGKTAALDLKLQKARDLSTQLTNAEWMISMPGSEDQKAQLLNCVGCHTLERVVRSTHDTDEFMQTMARMNAYAQVSQPIKPQTRMDPSYGENPERFRKQAEYASTINLSNDETWRYPFKTLPRLKGRSTHVIVTEYQLPRPTIEPHDVIIGQDGMAWYTNFGEEFIGKLDPKTGKHTEYALPVLKPDFPQGSLDIEQAKDGMFYIGMMYQAAVGQLDPKTGKVKVYALPKEWNDNVAQLNMVTMRFDVDGKMWVDNAGRQDEYRLDLKSGKYEHIDPLTALPGGKHGHSIYDNAADSHDNLYFTDFQANYILRVDAKTGEVSHFQAPTPLSRNRRARMDSQDRLWFAEYRGNKIGMFDTKTQKFTEWEMPTPWTGPYFVDWDKQGTLWTGGMTTDRIVKLDPKTGETVEYQLPHETNIRRVFVDKRGARPVIWVGNNHSASIVKIEPLD